MDHSTQSPAKFMLWGFLKQEASFCFLEELLKIFRNIYFFLSYDVCLCVCTIVFACEGQRATSRTQFSPSNMWVFGIKLR